MYLFAEAPLAVSSGMGFAAISALRQSPDQVGLLTWIFLIAFVCHALFKFAGPRRVSFIALIVVLIITLSIGIFYVLKFYHLDTTTGHGCIKCPPALAMRLLAFAHIGCSCILADTTQVVAHILDEDQRLSWAERQEVAAGHR